MKNFIKNSTILLIIACVAIQVCNIAILYAVDKASYYSHERNYLLAYNRLNALKDTNKIVVVAGSNGGFSINSRIINMTFNLPVVNTSTHAGIGTRMQIETYKELFREGDVVVFCPEYESGKSRLYGGSVLLRIVSTYMPSAYRKFSLEQWLYLYKYFGVHLREVIRNRNCKEFEGPYSAKAINEYGDIEWERKHKDTIDNYNLSGIMDEDLIAYYKYVHNFAQSKGIKLVFLPPTFMKSNFKKCERQIDSLAYSLKKNGIPWQSLPSRYSFPDSLYFDTPYHMTSNGAIKRTEVLVDDLHRILGLR